MRDLVPSARPLVHSGVTLWRRGLPGALLLLLGACPPPLTWVAPPDNPRPEEQERARCQLEAERARFFTEEPTEARTARIEHETELCLKAAGWRHIPRPSDPSPP
jgi:hypothetical protein